LPLAIYTVFEAQNGLPVALAISALLVIVSLAILLSLKLTTPWQSSPPTSLFLSGRSASS
jgi:ABC-type sulfate transport system permease component